jgi:hypothetical protein
MPTPAFSTSLLYVAMTQNVCRRASCAALLLLAAIVLAPEAGASDRLVVRVYGEKNGDEGDSPLVAIQTAAAIVDETGIAADWLDCRGRDLPRACTTVRGRGDLIVRLTPRFIASAAASAEAVRAGDDNSGLILGVAVVDRTTQLGTLATVFLENVEAVATRAGVDRASLLGRVIAHEVGHLLQGKTGHSRAGLMREVWTGEELGLNRRDDWSFAAPEQREMRAAVAKR